MSNNPTKATIELALGVKYEIEVHVPRHNSWDKEIEGERVDGVSHARVIGLSRDEWFTPNAKKASMLIELYQAKGINAMVDKMAKLGIFKEIEKQYAGSKEELDEDDNSLEEDGK